MQRGFVAWFSALILFSSLSLFAERGIQPKQNGLDTPLGDYHLLVIGIDDYLHWPTLNCAVRDAKAVRGLITTPCLRTFC